MKDEDGMDTILEKDEPKDGWMGMGCGWGLGMGTKNGVYLVRPAAGSSSRQRGRRPREISAVLRRDGWMGERDEG